MSARRLAKVDTSDAWIRLGASLLLSSIGGVGMWSVVVALPAVETEFRLDRSLASLPYVLTMIGFAFGGVLMGRFVDRRGIVPTLAVATTALSLGYIASGFATNLWQFSLAQGLLIGLCGSSAVFGPLIADISHWFVRRRGLAVAVCASGSYVAGAVWPVIVQHAIATVGWRWTHIGIGLFCPVAMFPLILFLRQPRPEVASASTAALAAGRRGTLGLRPNVVQALLWMAGLACCVAMAMPQVHMVAYCGDLGYGAARGSQMLSLMMACGIVSRIASGFIADRIGGLATLFIGSLLQGTALLLYLAFDSLGSLFAISALFGLFQGGIVPSYAIIVREYFPPAEAGTRVGIVLMATLFGMALGGWMAGAIFDQTGSYAMAFANGTLWNLLNVAIVALLIMRSGGMRTAVRATLPLRPSGSR